MSTNAAIAASLFISGFVLFAIGAAHPALLRAWTAPAADKLEIIAAHRVAWLWANGLFLAAAVATLLGLLPFTILLVEAGGGILMNLGFDAYFVAATVWVVSLVFRLTAMVSVAEEARISGAMPSWYPALSAWAGGLFLLYTALANLAFLLYGIDLVDTGYLSAWAGWFAIGFSALVLVQLVVTRDGIPGLYHVVPLVFGIALFFE